MLSPHGGTVEFESNVKFIPSSVKGSMKAKRHFGLPDFMNVTCIPFAFLSANGMCEKNISYGYTIIVSKAVRSSVVRMYLVKHLVSFRPDQQQQG